MKRKLICLAILCAVTVRPSYGAQQVLDKPGRFIFYAVLEGCFEDGLTTKDVSQILLHRPNENAYFHFIYACPICTATIQALQTYQSRPEHFYSLKSGASTFGAGLSAELKQQLYSDNADGRLTAINSLIQRWVTARMTLLGLSEDKRAQLETALEEKRKEGMNHLESFKAEGTAFVNAPAFVTLEECAVCNGAVGKCLKSATKAQSSQ
jgi:hypothetical protein